MRNIIAFCAVALACCLSLSTVAQSGGKAGMSHEKFSRLLKKLVTEEGLVRYEEIKRNRRNLQDYLESLQENPPTAAWSNEQQLAYWINAHNAYTLQMVAEYYPLKSVRDLGPENQVIFVNTAADRPFIRYGKQMLSLNELVYGLMRRQFTQDPRYLLALHNATQSGPALRREAYEAATLDLQLNEQAKDFINRQCRTQSGQLSPLFKWYAADFRRGEGRSAFINRYALYPVPAQFDPVYLSYNWTLDDARQATETGAQ